LSRAQPSTYQVDLPDISLRVTEWPGGGDPVLLYAVDLRFHGGSGRHGAVDWRLMARDVEQLLVALDLQRVIGVGHSIGGYLTAYVAALQLSRFRQLLLIDPVIKPRRSYAAIFPSTPIDPTQNPVSRRKNVWRDAQEMYQRFKGRAPFDRWQDQVLRDYCAYALREVPGESFLQLACDPLHEAAIYLNQRDNDAIYDVLPALKLPVTVLRARYKPGVQNDFSLSPTWPGLAGLLTNGREFYYPGMSHFIPMEDPALVAAMIREAVAAN
jgi:pimeloyl-ACP methyl ester carboxylesterase